MSNKRRGGVFKMTERYQPTESREARAERRAAQTRWGFERSDYRENHPDTQNSVDGQPGPNVTWGTEAGRIDAEAHRSLYGMDHSEDKPDGDLGYDINAMANFIAKNKWSHSDQSPEQSKEKPRDIDVV